MGTLVTDEAGRVIRAIGDAAVTILFPSDLEEGERRQRDRGLLRGEVERFQREVEGRSVPQVRGRERSELLAWLFGLLSGYLEEGVLRMFIEKASARRWDVGESLF